MRKRFRGLVTGLENTRIASSCEKDPNVLGVAHQKLVVHNDPDCPYSRFVLGVGMHTIIVSQDEAEGAGVTDDRDKAK